MFDLVQRLNRSSVRTIIICRLHLVVLERNRARQRQLRPYNQSSGYEIWYAAVSSMQLKLGQEESYQSAVRQMPA